MTNKTERKAMYTATFTQTETHQQCGTYKPTTVDAIKETVDFTVIQTAPFYIRWANGNTEKVTASKLNKLQSKHSWATNF